MIKSVAPKFGIKIVMATKSGDVDYRICEFLWHGPY